MGKKSNLEQESNGVPVVQLATRVPKVLYKALKLHCVGQGVSIAEIVAAGIARELQAQGVKVAKADKAA